MAQEVGGSVAGVGGRASLGSCLHAMGVTGEDEGRTNIMIAGIGMFAVWISSGLGRWRMGTPGYCNKHGSRWSLLVAQC